MATLFRALLPIIWCTSHPTGAGNLQPNSRRRIATQRGGPNAPAPLPTPAGDLCAALVSAAATAAAVSGPSREGATGMWGPGTRARVRGGGWVEGGRGWMCGRCGITSQLIVTCPILVSVVSAFARKVRGHLNPLWVTSYLQLRGVSYSPLGNRYRTRRASASRHVWHSQNANSTFDNVGIRGSVLGHFYLHIFMFITSGRSVCCQPHYQDSCREEWFALLEYQAQVFGQICHNFQIESSC